MCLRERRRRLHVEAFPLIGIRPINQLANLSVVDICHGYPPVQRSTVGGTTGSEIRHVIPSRVPADLYPLELQWDNHCISSLRERERERERQTDRHTDRQTETEAERQTETDRDRETETDRHIDRQTYRQKERLRGQRD